MSIKRGKKRAKKGEDRRERERERERLEFESESEQKKTERAKGASDPH